MPMFLFKHFAAVMHIWCYAQ